MLVTTLRGKPVYRLGNWGIEKLTCRQSHNCLVCSRFTPGLSSSWLIPKPLDLKFLSRGQGETGNWSDSCLRHSHYFWVPLGAPPPPSLHSTTSVSPFSYSLCLLLPRFWYNSLQKCSDGRLCLHTSRNISGFKENTWRQHHNLREFVSVSQTFNKNPLCARPTAGCWW